MLLIIVFAGSLGWFPPVATRVRYGDRDRARHRRREPPRPARLTLTLGYIGQYMIVMRSSLLDVKDEDYIATARAKGLTTPSSADGTRFPTPSCRRFTLIVLSFGFVLGGAIVIETVFSWPGLGLLTYEAIQDQDFPVLQAVFLLTSLAVIVANLVADVLTLPRSPGSRRRDG